MSPGTSATTSWRPSADSTVPSTGERVVNGYSATFGRAFEIRVRSDDLPAFGRPTSAASARSLRRSSISRSSPGSPTSAKRGVCRLGPAKCLLPRPPMPPCATTTRAPACARSETSSSPSKTCVPTGTVSIASSPRAPLERRPPPPPPRPARSFWFRRKPERSRRLGSATSTTSPPSPPSPPSGPPRGTYFSRRKWIEPSPPRPAIAVSRARSWNIEGTVLSTHRRARHARARPLTRSPSAGGETAKPTRSRASGKRSRRRSGRSGKRRVGEWRTRSQSRSSAASPRPSSPRSEEHTSELQSHSDLVCRLLLEKKKMPDRSHRDPIENLEKFLPRYTEFKKNTSVPIYNRTNRQAADHVILHETQGYTD